MEKARARFRRSEANQSIKDTLPHLPQEIIEQIMVCLPVKALLRFKCVSKPWFVLISSNRFIKAHIEKSSKDKSLEHHRIILGKSVFQAKQCFLPSFFDDPLAIAVDIDHPTCWSKAYIISSCNGLLCILKNKVDFVLWNPSTKKFKELPSFADDSVGNYEAEGNFVEAYGFGLDESNDDYRVFCMWNFRLPGHEKKALAKIYSSKMDSWRKVDDPIIGSDFKFRGSGTFVSGKLHWMGKSGDGRVRTVSFDLEDEIFGTVELPCDNGGGLLAEAIDGSLRCICPSKSDPYYADYWILKDYGVKDSWYKYATIYRPCGIKWSRDHFLGMEYDYHAYDHPLIVGAKGEILCWKGCGVNFILLKENGFIFGSHYFDGRVPKVYVESLVEP